MYNGKGQRVLYDKSRIRRQIKVVTVLIILSRPTTTNMNVGMWKTWECWKLSAGGSFLLITTQLQHENQFGWDKGDDDHTSSLDQIFGGFIWYFHQMSLYLLKLYSRNSLLCWCKILQVPYCLGAKLPGAKLARCQIFQVQFGNWCH